MAFSIKHTEKGYEWECFFSAYGAAGGVAPTLAAAKVELAIGQADVREQPFPPSLAATMRADPERFAADYPDPEGVE